MLALQGVCAVCKRDLDIITAGLVCTVCQRFYHGLCMRPLMQYKDLEQYVINVKDWLCESCLADNSRYEVQFRTDEEKEIIKQKAEVLLELREIIVVIDDMMSYFTRRCDHLIKIACLTRKHNTELRYRISLLVREGEVPSDLKSWVQKRKLIGFEAPRPISYRFTGSSCEEIYKIKQSFLTFRKKRNIHRPIFKDKSFFTKIFGRLKRKKKKRVTVLEKINAPPLKQRFLVAFNFLLHRHRRWTIQVVLFAILVLHTLIGAMVLYIIEGTHEREYRDKISTQRQVILRGLNRVEQIFTKVRFNNSKSVLNNISMEFLSSYYDFLESSITNYHKNGTFFKQMGNWDFLGSIFFCATTSMSVGYGDTIPVTDSGKIFTIIVAFTGIPLFLTFASSLGKTLNDLIHLGSVKLHVRRRSTIMGTNYEIEPHFTGFPLYLFFLLYLLYIVLVTIIFMIVESWPFFESAYFVTLTLATIGIGDTTPNNRNFLLFTIMILIGGHVLTATAIHMILWKLNKKFQIINAKLAYGGMELYSQH